MTIDPAGMHPPLGDSDWRLVGLDIDGTLMHWGGAISAPVVDAVEKARMCRNHVILATGRNIVATMPVAEQLRLRRGWAVCSNGAVTIRLNPASPGGYELEEKVTFNPRAALEIIRDEMPDVLFAVEDLGVGFCGRPERPVEPVIDCASSPPTARPEATPTPPASCPSASTVTRAPSRGPAAAAVTSPPGGRGR